MVPRHRSTYWVGGGNSVYPNEYAGRHDRYEPFEILKFLLVHNRNDLLRNGKPNADAQTCWPLSTLGYAVYDFPLYHVIRSSYGLAVCGRAAAVLFFSC